MKNYFTVDAISNGKEYSKSFPTYIEAYTYAGQLPHYLSDDCSIVIIDRLDNGRVCGAYNKFDGWRFGLPILQP